MTRYFSIFIAIAALSFVLGGCKERETSMLSAPSLSAIDMVGTIDPLHREGTLKIKSRSGDGPWEIKYLDPVEWDGVSPVKPGVFYTFKNMDEAVKAYADDADALSTLSRIAECATCEEKAKAPASSLAADGWVASAYGACVPGQGGQYKVQCLTHTENPFGFPGPVKHYSMFWANDVVIGSYLGYYTDMIPHEEDYSFWRNCPVTMSCCCDVYNNHTIMIQGCSGDVDCNL
ncbi:MAG: hypothetical protein A2Z86_07920 [Candidatus Glassbacteria bacterium GWA2_58_10]|uniref:Lipoprotein n=1 Tax=Candidatus Glassbacteria bacterium GWA2_58_10 TaxID=1817865 RepID=A0A1F5YHI5_9BACT|nr:MAG: hypothetical protein A2Z86_07920 [Candidatus Glassbacteria bacterium GWA2_58_10]